MTEEYDRDGNLTRWTCGDCGELVSVRHYLQRGGVIVHDPEAALLEASGLVEPERTPPGRDLAGGAR